MPDPISAVEPSMPRGLKAVGIAAATVALVVVAAGIFARSNETAVAARWSQDQSVPTVQLVMPTPPRRTQDLALPGTMAAWNTAHIFARVPGYIHAWYRDIGAKVGTGTPLGAIDTPELDQQINQARAALARAQAEAVLARTTAARWKDLLSTASVSQQETDEKNAAALTKQAVVREAQADLGRLLALKALATVRAPFAGLVIARNADIGDLVGPGATNQQPMFSIADESRIRTYVNVPQQYAGLMHNGLPAELTVPDHPGQTFNARVVANSEAINAQSGSLQVQLVSDNPGLALHAGGYAEVRFELPGQADQQTIPASALLMRGNGTRVATVMPNGRVRLLRVELGRDLGPSVQIVSGLPAGTAVVDNPPDSIADGELVRVQGKHG